MLPPAEGMTMDDNDRLYYNKPRQVKIVEGVFGCWLTFYSQSDINEKLRGRIYRNPSWWSLRRLAKILSGKPANLVLDPLNIIFLINQ